MSSSKFKFLTLMLLVLISIQFAPTTNSTPAGDNILITEVLYDAPTSDATEEWIELFNPTTSPIDLTGWTIEDNYDSFVLSGIIPAKSYYVFARDGTAFNALYGYDANQTVGWN
ncbi:MAG: lamin tail domain-containing protein, partial [Candidatus Heimdallarchaeota archaeon]|nr:lamin tail domain-containing protein [Candidatus Heimdallarchaeota archaeon]